MGQPSGSVGGPASRTADSPGLSGPLPPVQPIKSAAYVTDFVEVIEIYDNGFDGYTFDNVDRNGRPKVSQTQDKPRRQGYQHNRKTCIPVETISAHHRATSLARDGTLVGKNAGATGEVNHQGRRPIFFNCPPAEDDDVEFVADIGPGPAVDE